MNKDFTNVSLLSEIATYASCVIPDVLARKLFHEALDMFLKAYRLQAKIRVQTQEDDVAHMETCQCFVDDDVLLVSVSMMFRKILQNKHFLGFWDRSMEERQMYMHLTFVILCDITVRFWDDHVIEMNLAPSISRWRADRDREDVLDIFNTHYFNVFSWIDYNADIFKYDLTDGLTEYNGPPKAVSIEEETTYMDETYPMDLSEYLN